MSSIKGFNSLSKTKEFNYFYKNSKVYHTKFFVLFYSFSEDRRFGVVASKKVGNAVKRNYSKRRLRALLINQLDKLKIGVYILVAKPGILDQRFSYLERLFIKSIKATQ